MWNVRPKWFYVALFWNFRFLFVLIICHFDHFFYIDQYTLLAISEYFVWSFMVFSFILFFLKVCLKNKIVNIVVVSNISGNILFLYCFLRLTGLDVFGFFPRQKLSLESLKNWQNQSNIFLALVNLVTLLIPEYPNVFFNIKFLSLIFFLPYLPWTVTIVGFTFFSRPTPIGGREIHIGWIREGGRMRTLSSTYREPHHTWEA